MEVMEGFCVGIRRHCLSDVRKQLQRRAKDFLDGSAGIQLPRRIEKEVELLHFGGGADFFGRKKSQSRERREQIVGEREGCPLQIVDRAVQHDFDGIQ